MRPGQGVAVGHFRNVSGRQLLLLEQTVDGPGNQLLIALVPDPAFFPGVLELFENGPPAVDEVDGQRVGSLQLGHHIVLADHECGGAVAVHVLLRIAGLDHPAVGRGHQRALHGAGFDGVQGIQQGGGPRLVPGLEVRHADVLPQIKGARDDAGLLPHQVGRGTGGEVQAAHLAPVLPFQAVDAGRGGHGHTVLVLVGHRPLSRRGKGHQEAGGFVHFGPAQPVPGNMGRIRSYADHSAKYLPRTNSRMPD